jgi:hypothetical protein
MELIRAAQTNWRLELVFVDGGGDVRSAAQSSEARRAICRSELRG